MSTNKDDHEKLLQSYLEQHLAGAVGGIEHIERMAELDDAGETGQVLRAVAEQIRRERVRLRELAELVGVDAEPHIKKGMAWIAEKLARVMTDPRLGERSPLGRVLDLELMMSAISGKRALWQTLAVVAETDPRLSQAEMEQGVMSSLAQIDALLELHRSAVRVAFTDLGADGRQSLTGTG